MNKLLVLLVSILMFSCTSQQEPKIPVYGWVSGPRNATDQEILDQFTDFKEKGIDGLMYSGGHDPKPIKGWEKLPKKQDWSFMPGFQPWFRERILNLKRNGMA